jgi:F-type H+-transporting ATPase subunit gamma
MSELQQLQRKLDSVASLEDIVQAMRNMAAIYVRRAETTIEGSRQYADVVQTALRLALRLTARDRVDPPADAHELIVVFSGDQGMCGAYNERIGSAALERIERAAGPTTLVTIGHRAKELLTARTGSAPALALRAPGSLEGIRARVPDLAAAVLAQWDASGARRMTFIYNAYESMGRYTETVHQVLPPAGDDADDSTKAGYDPILTAPPADVLAHLIEEYFFIEFYRALLESHASENGARLAAMTAAGINIEKHRTQLTQEYQSERQQVITAELLEIVGGAEALKES